MHPAFLLLLLHYFPFLVAPSPSSSDPSVALAS